MIQAKDVTQILRDLKYDVVTGTPGSNMLGIVEAAKAYDIYYPSATPEGAAAFAFGASFAGKKCAICLYHSALTSAMSFFTTANRAYAVPFLAIIDVSRGEEHVEHEWVSRRVEDMALAMDAKVVELPDSQTVAADQLEAADEFMRKTNKPVFLIIRKRFPLQPTSPEVIPKPLSLLGVITRSRRVEDLVRADAIKIIQEEKGDAVIVADRSSTGSELSIDGTIPGVFTNLGNLGYDTAIGLGLAQMQGKPVITVQGDFAAVLGLPNLIMAGHYAPKNHLHIVIDNGTMQNPGGHGTIGPNKDFMAIALGAGYNKVIECKCKEEIAHAMVEWKANPTHTFIYILVRPLESEKFVPQKPFDPLRDKVKFFEYLNK